MRKRDGNVSEIRALVRGIGWLLRGGITIVVVLVLFGVFDPRPIEPVTALSFQPGTTVCEQTQQVTIPKTGTILLDWQLAEPVALVMGKEARPSFALRVLPEGYVELVGDGAIIRPLGTFPHVRPEGNEIWLDVEDGAVTAVRLNREIYWQGRVPLDSQNLRIQCFHA